MSKVCPIMSSHNGLRYCTANCALFTEAEFIETDENGENRLKKNHVCVFAFIGSRIDGIENLLGDIAEQLDYISDAELDISETLCEGNGG